MLITSLTLGVIVMFIMRGFVDEWCIGERVVKYKVIRAKGKMQSGSKCGSKNLKKLIVRLF